MKEYRGESMRNRERKLSASQIITLGFAGLILLGSVLLMLPAATKSGLSASFADALFTATSATCVTGLVPFDTWTQWSGFGQVVIICLILMFGKLGDTIGKDKVFKAGILGFLAGAILCFSAQNYPMLIIGRVVEGIGSAATMANSQGLIVQGFPVHERGKVKVTHCVSADYKKVIIAVKEGCSVEKIELNSKTVVIVCFL